MSETPDHRGAQPGPRRLPGNGWLTLVGGGEFSFEETLDADSAWLEKAPPGPIGFVPAASGSSDYPTHFAEYLADVFEREVRAIPIFRPRDARRRRNAERIAECSSIYVGGGVADLLIDALVDTPALEALAGVLQRGGAVVAIAGAAQAFGIWARSLRFGEALQGLGWLPGGVFEPTFSPGHDRRLRRLVARPGVNWGLGLPAGSAMLFGPDSAIETVGPAWILRDPEAEVVEWVEWDGADNRS